MEEGQPLSNGQWIDREQSRQALKASQPSLLQGLESSHVYMMDADVNTENLKQHSPPKEADLIKRIAATAMQIIYKHQGNNTKRLEEEIKQTLLLEITIPQQMKKWLDRITKSWTMNIRKHFEAEELKRQFSYIQEGTMDGEDAFTDLSTGERDTGDDGNEKTEPAFIPQSLFQKQTPRLTSSPMQSPPPMEDTGVMVEEQLRAVHDELKNLKQTQRYETGRIEILILGDQSTTIDVMKCKNALEFHQKANAS